MSDSINIKRVAKNTAILYVRVLVVMLVNIYASRVVLKILGVEDFGTYNVVAGAVALFGFLNTAMSMATQRFLNYELGRKNEEGLKAVFNMALKIHLSICVILAVLAETIGLWLVYTQLDIPPQRFTAAMYAYQFAIVSMIINIAAVPYTSAILAHEKMNVYAYICIVEALLKLGLIFLLPVLGIDKLILYAILMSSVQVCVFFAYYIYSRLKLSECKFSFSMRDKNLFKQMSGFIGWNICGQIAQMLSVHGVNMLMNIFHGVIVNAAMTITNQVNGAIVMFVNNFQTSFRPQIMKSYAAEEYDEVNRFACVFSKYSFFLLYILSVPILFNIDIILDIWLETPPAHTAVFCKLVFWYSYLEALGMPLVMAIMASGRNKYYQIFFSITLSLNIILSYIFLKNGYPPEIVFIIKVFVSIFIIAVRMYFAKKQSFVSPKNFITKSLVPSGIVIILTLPIYYILKIPYGTSFTIDILLTISLEILILLIIYFIGINKQERVFLLGLIKRKGK